MKTSPSLSGRVLLPLALLLAIAPLRAEDAIKYIGKPGSEVKIDGTSNIHAWTVKGMIIAGSMEVSPAFNADLKTLSPLPKVEVTIPVRSLKSGNSVMDDVMQTHMKMKEFRDIKYRLTELKVKTEPKSPNGPGEYTSKGELAVSGKTNTIEMPVTIERVEGGNLKIKGAVPLKMTSFSIQPPAPKLAMGLIHTGDDVQITLEWVLGKATPAK